MHEWCQDQLAMPIHKQPQAAAAAAAPSPATMCTPIPTCICMRNQSSTLKCTSGCSLQHLQLAANTANVHTSSYWCCNRISDESMQATTCSNEHSAVLNCHALACIAV
jgi:hypothetical protein